MQIRLHLDKSKVEELTWGDLCDIENAQDSGRPFRVMRDMVSRFMVDESGAYLSKEAAMAHLSKLSIVQANDVLNQFTKAVNDYAVRPQNGEDSSSP